jgi:hypothetical protein
MTESSRITKINVNLTGRDGEIYHEIIYVNGKRTYCRPTDRNYWTNLWGHIIEHRHQAVSEGLIVHGLVPKNSKCYNSDYKPQLEMPAQQTLREQIAEDPTTLKDLIDG